jgi:hypothetical protein
MKTNLITLKKGIYISLILLLCSCANITEEIYINADGSGKYLVYTDAVSSMRGMMSGMMSSMYPEASQDSLMQVIESQIWEQFPARVDSIIDYSSRVPDSIKNDPDKQKYLNNLEMFMKGSKEAGYINSGMRYSFASVKELEQFQAFMNENQSATGGGMGMNMPDVKVQYRFDGSSFSRTTIMDEVEELSDSTKMMLNTLLEGSKARLIIHLPKKVKKASKDQLVGKEGKDVTYEFDLIKVLNGEQSTDVSIDF